MTEVGVKRIFGNRRYTSQAIAAAALVAVFFGAAPAHSDPGAPAFLQGKYGLACTPECTLCHATNLGNYGNYRLATLPNGQTSTTEGFILSLKTCGFIPTDRNTWDPALTQCEATHVDSDHDGTPDIEELKAGTDPNNASPGAPICGPTYGCVRVARGGSADGVALLVSGAVLFAGIALTRRRAKLR